MGAGEERPTAAVLTTTGGLPVFRVAPTFSSSVSRVPASCRLGGKERRRRLGGCVAPADGVAGGAPPHRREQSHPYRRGPALAGHLRRRAGCGKRQSNRHRVPPPGKPPRERDLDWVSHRTGRLRRIRRMGSSKTGGCRGNESSAYPALAFASVPALAERAGITGDLTTIGFPVRRGFPRRFSTARARCAGCAPMPAGSATMRPASRSSASPPAASPRFC